jgi:hypothetical protein
MSADPAKNHPDRPLRDRFRRLPGSARFMVGMILGVALVALALGIYALIMEPPPSPPA